MAQKILYVITQGQWGGAQRYVFDLAKGLANEFDITIAVGELTGEKDLQQRIAKELASVKVIQLKHLVRKISPWHDLMTIFELAQLYKNVKPDVIHLNSTKAGIIGSLSTYIFHTINCHLTYTVHGWIFNEPLSSFKKWVYFNLEKYTAKKKDKIIVLSESDKKDALEKLKISKTKVTKINLGIEPSSKQLTKVEAQNKLISKCDVGIDYNRFWFGTIAGLYKSKGLDLLIRAVKKSKLKANFIIIGSGPEENKIKTLVSRYQLKRKIYLLGKIANASDFLPAFDYFVLPSRKEGLPYALIEARAAKIPIIATNVGGVIEIVQDKKNGLLVQPRDINDLSNKLITAITTKFELTSSLNKFDLATMLIRTKELYQKL